MLYLQYFVVVLKKKERLEGKEVRFLTRKRQSFVRGIFLIFYCAQYPNRDYHQISFHVPLALSKRAVIRHQIKRILIASYEEFIKQQPWNTNYSKCFVMFQKSKLDPLINLLEKKDKNQIKTYLSTEFQSVFSSFLHSQWKKSQNKSS